MTSAMRVGGGTFNFQLETPFGHGHGIWRAWVGGPAI
jgi:hypothetical protein